MKINGSDGLKASQTLIYWQGGKPPLANAMQMGVGIIVVPQIILEVHHTSYGQGVHLGQTHCQISANGRHAAAVHTVPMGGTK